MSHPLKARYRVRLRDTKGFVEIVTVWAEGEAIEETKNWFRVRHDLGQRWVEEEAELVVPIRIRETSESPNPTRPSTISHSLPTVMS